MQIKETFILNWNDDGYKQFCKVHLTEDGIYYREYDTGKRIFIEPITEDEFTEQSKNHPTKK